MDSLAQFIRENAGVPAEVVREKICSAVASLVYKPLADKSIRLARLKMTREDSLKLELFTTQLDHGTKYDALSYCWGTSETFRIVPCNEYFLVITESLYQALWSVKKYGDVDVIWVDQICINQRNIAEKSSQVRLMHQIFKGARKVWAWLGDPDPAELERALRMIKGLKKLDKLGSREDIPSQLTEADFERVGLPSYDSSDWPALGAFFSIPWFQRIWVVQEVAAASSVVVCLGSRLFPWSDIARIAPLLEMRAKLAPINKEIHGASHMSLVSSENWEPQPLSMLLVFFRHFNATDPRDKVYALLGLATDASELALEPDYSNSVAKVYWAASRAILMKRRSLNILYMVGYASVEYEDELPSWVPDWSNTHIPAPFITFKNEDPVPNQNFCANKGLSSSQPPTCDDEKRLILQGVKFEAVDKAGPEITRVSNSAYDTIVDLLPQFLNTIKINALYRTGEDVKAAFALTLTASRNSKREFVSDKAAHLSDFNAYLNKCCSFPTEPWSLKQNIRVAIFALIAIYLIVFDFGEMLEGLKNPIPLTVFSGVPLIYLAPFISRNIRRWWFIAGLKRHILYSGVSYSASSNANTEDFQFSLIYGSHHRRFFTTTTGYFGVGPSTMQSGDFVVILCDAVAPFVLRQEGDEFRLVGACYVHGIMFGEVSKASEASDPDRPHIQSFIIH
jgi:hypothetical protein